MNEDPFVFSTDGLHRKISESGIQTVLSRQQPLEEKARDLIQAALDAGGNNNITVVLVQGET